MQPPEPVTTPTAPSPAPLDSTQALAAHLDTVMETSAIAANAVRDEEAGIPQPEPTRQEATTAETATDDSDEQDEDDEQEAEPAETTAPEADGSSAETPEPPKYSRRDAAKFAAELEQRTKDLAEARAIVAKAEGQLNAHKAADQHILTQLAEVSGYTVESNGRYRYDNLRDKVVRGQATEQEAVEVREMTQWAELAGPIYRAAEQQVTRAFSTDWNGLKDLEGIGEAGLAKLSQAPNGVAGAREMHALAYQAGKKAAKAETDQTIARLRAENKSLKTGAVARAPQPAVLNGAAVPSGKGSFYDRAFKANGEINEDFDREVRAGKWLGVDLASQ